MIAAQDSSDVSLQSTLTAEESISSQQLFNHLFEACNKIYGKVAKESYKSYIIPLLFFKRISDMYDEEYQTALDDSGGDKEYAAIRTRPTAILQSGQLPQRGTKHYLHHKQRTVRAAPGGR